MAKQSQKTKTTHKKSSQSADFEPTKMTFAVAAVAAVSLTLLAVIAVQ